MSSDVTLAESRKKSSSHFGWLRSLGVPAVKGVERYLEMASRSILILGETGHGKSTFANFILGEQKFNVGAGLDRCD